MTSQIGDAVTGVDKDVYIVKGNEIIGEARTQTQHAGSVSINFPEEFWEKNIVPLINKIPNEMVVFYHPSKLLFVHFSYFSGNFAYFNVNENEDEEKKLTDWLEDVRIVEKFYFQCGLVPDAFKDVQGYKSLIEE